MITPCWNRQKDWLSWVKVGQELASNAASASATKGLNSSNPFDWSIYPISKLDSFFYKPLISFDWEVLLVKSGISDNLLFNLANNWENIWLSIVVLIDLCVALRTYFFNFENFYCKKILQPEIKIW